MGVTGGAELVQVMHIIDLRGGSKTLSLGHCSCAASGTSKQGLSKTEAFPTGPVESQGQLTG